MAEETENICKVFNELDLTIKVVGTEKLIEILKYHRLNNSDLNEQQINNAIEIIKAVCETLNVSVEEFFDRKRKNNRRIAIGISAFFIQKELNLNNSDISYIFKKPDELVSMYKQEIVKLSESHPQDREVLEKIKQIKEILNNKKSND